MVAGYLLALRWAPLALHDLRSRDRCLVFARVRDHALSAMRRWSVRQVLVLFLAIFVTAGMGLSSVQANQMAMTMAMTSEMDMAGHDGCPGCPSGDGESGTKAMTCAAICVAPLLAILPHAEPIAFMATNAYEPIVMPVLHGQAWPSDPYPPRTTDIG